MPFKRFFLYLILILIAGFSIWFFLIYPSPSSTSNSTNPKPVKTISTIEKLAVLIFKQNKKMEIWGSQNDNYQLLQSSEIQLFSDHTGPKIYADQPHVPEGIYHILEVDSLGNISLNFPNKFDQTKMKADNREELFTAFKIHSVASQNSIGLSLEDLKSLKINVKKAGANNTKFLIFPNDPRSTKQFINCHQCPHWTPELYGMLHLHLQDFEYQKDVFTSDSTKSLN